MKRVLIVSKTRMRGGHVCVGGHDLDERMRSLRLLQPDGTNMPADARFEIGQLWELNYQPAPNVQPPHVEDVLVDPSGARHTESGDPSAHSYWAASLYGPRHRSRESCDGPTAERAMYPPTVLSRPAVPATGSRKMATADTCFVAMEGAGAFGT